MRLWLLLLYTARVLRLQVAKWWMSLCLVLLTKGTQFQSGMLFSCMASLFMLQGETAICFFLVHVAFRQNLKWDSIVWGASQTKPFSPRQAWSVLLGSTCSECSIAWLCLPGSRTASVSSSRAVQKPSPSASTVIAVSRLSNCVSGRTWPFAPTGREAALFVIL